MSDAFSETVTRALENAYKVGFDAGIEHQKKAAPPPKARELAKQLNAMRERAERAEERIASVSGVTREDLAKREYERGVAEGAQQLEAARDAAAEAFDAALTAFGQVQERLAAVTAERDELRALLTETPIEAAVQASTGQERKHCRCGRLSATMNDYMSAPPDLRDDKRGLCWAEWTGEACR